jgi:hypothetical protein
MFDPTLTPKQRTELRKEVRRRERLGDQRQGNTVYGNRVNSSIRAATTPIGVLQTASRYKNAMTPNQRENMVQRARNVRATHEDKALKRFFESRNQQELLKSLRDLKKTVKTTADYMKRNRLAPQ